MEAGEGAKGEAAMKKERWRFEPEKLYKDDDKYGHIAGRGPKVWITDDRSITLHCSPETHEETHWQARRIAELPQMHEILEVLAYSMITSERTAAFQAARDLLERIGPCPAKPHRRKTIVGA